MRTLKDAKIGETSKVVKLHGEGAVKRRLMDMGITKGVKLHGEGAVKRRLMDMGITKGVEINIRKVAPLGDPVEITVRGYELSGRKADAEMIEIE